MSINIIVAFLLSLIISTYSIDQIILFSRRIGWGDDPSEARKIHKRKIPNLGGISVFMATMVAYFAFSDYSTWIRPDKLFSISILLFFVGLKDDMEPISAWRRFIIEFLCAFFIIYLTDVRITTLYGIFGIQTLPYFISFIITSLFIVGCINAYNMIDGLDGLLGSLSILGVICFGLIFNASGEWLWTLLCVSLLGALIGFLIYNWHPAQVFMGNGGSIFIGAFFACIALRIMQLQPVESEYFSIIMPHTIALGIISIPVIDMITVFVLRICHGESPFKADRRHIHHRLLNIGLKHNQATLVLVFLNVVILLFAYMVQSSGALRSLVYTLLFCFLIELIFIYLGWKFKKYV